MAENTTPKDTTTKADKERLEAFYKTHKVPVGFQIKAVRNTLVLEPVTAKGEGK